VDVAKQIQASHPDKELNQSVFEMKENYDKLKKRSDVSNVLVVSLFDRRVSRHPGMILLVQ
jgi:hypothetical protein